MKFVLRPAARVDLETIWLQTAEKWGVGQADAYVADINKRIVNTAEMPGLGSEVFGLPPDYRKVPSGAHRVIYRCTQTELVVVRIVHEREDVLEDLGDLW